jgi:glycerate 2-kinase
MATDPDPLVVLLCPTAFKGTLSAAQVAAAMAEGVAAVGSGTPATRPLVARRLPLSDGGHGLLDALASVRAGSVRRAAVTGPLGERVWARYLAQGVDAVVETAEACGLHLVPDGRRDPLNATTRGVGELLLVAAGAGGAACGAPLASDRLVVGLGGSATVDAGAGMAAALGWSLLDDRGRSIPPGGAGLLLLHAIEPPATPPPLPPAVVLADVVNPLLGADGAAAVYGPQKGASPGDVALLEEALGRWSDVVVRDLGRRVAELPGAGAAGGLGAGFGAYLDAPPRSGSDWLLEAVAFDAELAAADVVVTGEGSWDRQSAMGKVTGEVVSRARAASVPVLVVAGRIEGELPRGAVGAVGRGGRLEAPAITALVAGALPALLGSRGHG